VKRKNWIGHETRKMENEEKEKLLYVNEGRMKGKRQRRRFHLSTQNMVAVASLLLDLNSGAHFIRTVDNSSGQNKF